VPLYQATGRRRRQPLGRNRRGCLRQCPGRVSDRPVKTELIKPRGPWRTAEHVEIAALEYVDWFNNRRLYEACGDIPPAELETAYYSQNAGLAEAG
jgi:transposase InsO family protein